VPDRRYSTKAWQVLRLAVLRRDGYRCQIQGRRCAGIANTAHHILPSSTHPHLFFDPANLQAACKPCNYGDGAHVRVDNRTSRQLVAHLERVVEEQREQIDELLAELARRDRVRPTPRIG
jgi:hypothetical protein